MDAVQFVTCLLVQTLIKKESKPVQDWVLSLQKDTRTLHETTINGEHSVIPLKLQSAPHHILRKGLVCFFTGFVNLAACVPREIHIAKIDLFRYNAFVINACVFVIKQKNACHETGIHDKHQG